MSSLNLLVYADFLPYLQPTLAMWSQTIVREPRAAQKPYPLVSGWNAHNMVARLFD